MATITTVGEFRALLGMRPTLRVPSGQWMPGPFDLAVTIPNGSAMDVNLHTQDPWYGDPSVRAAYSPSDGSSDRMKAVVAVEAVELILADGPSAKLDLDALDNLIQEGTMPYLEATIGTTTWRLGLIGAIRHMLHLTQIKQAVAADGEFGIILGGPKKLPSSIVVNLEEATLKLKSDNDPALGAAHQAWLRLHGAMIPSSEARGPGEVAGGSSTCGTDDDVGLLIEDERVMELQSTQMYGTSPAY